MEKGGGGGGGGAPTGCYKCGRPGHWSRDCPSKPTSNSNNDGSNQDLDRNPSGSANVTQKTSYPFKNNASRTGSAAEKPKRLPRTRPRLTPDLLLSNDGLGHILRHFPRAFKYRGRGHEVSDLGNLLGLYADWHSRLLPYFSFGEFVHKVEHIGAKNRVKNTIRDLRETVANGLDPTKLRDPQIQEDMPNHEKDDRELVEQNHFQEDTYMQNPIQDNTCVQNPENDDLQETILDEIGEKAMEEPSQASDDNIVQAAAYSGVKEIPSKAHESTSSSSQGIAISEQQLARMEANRLKALEKAAARARNLQ